MSFYGTSGDPSDRFSDRCFNWIPCLSDSAKRSTLCMQLMLVMLHLVFIGFLFIFDTEFVDSLKRLHWYTIIYLLLFVATIVQYLFTSGSSPGYVLDAMREFARVDASLRTSETSKQPASCKNGSVVVTLDGNQRGENILGNNRMNWTKMVMDMYPNGTSVRICTCSYCNIVLPPRAKHCHDCEKCVLQFDHHCVWLGTCIGLGNHCRFWWYIFFEFALCIMTGIWYIDYLNDHIKDSWLKDMFVIIMLAILAVSLIFLFLLLIFHSKKGILGRVEQIYLPIPDPINDNHEQEIRNLEAAKTKIKVLKKKLRSETAQNKERILDLQQRVEKMQKVEHEGAVGIDPEVQLKLCKLKDSEDEAEELKKWNYNLEIEKSDLAQRLENVQILATAVLEVKNYLIMTNQTTYELVRRRRIFYLRSIPERVYPFSEGVCRNLYMFCCATTGKYRMEALPNSHAVDQISIP